MTDHRERAEQWLASLAAPLAQRIVLPSDRALDQVIAAAHVHALLALAEPSPQQPAGYISADDLSGVARIGAERVRQVMAEGYSTDHDDEHTDHQLTLGAAAYLMAAMGVEAYDELRGDVICPRPTEFWPFSDGFKPSDDPARNLEKAGAMIAAELDRLRRKENP